MNNKLINRYNAVLKFTNDILISIGEPIIDDITKFSIKREQLININVDNFIGSLFEHFKKDTLKYYMRNRIKSYILTVFKVVFKKIGFSFVAIRKNCSVTKDNNDKSYVIYYISEKI